MLGLRPDLPAISPTRPGTSPRKGKWGKRLKRSSRLSRKTSRSTTVSWWQCYITFFHIWPCNKMSFVFISGMFYTDSRRDDQVSGVTIVINWTRLRIQFTKLQGCSLFYWKYVTLFWCALSQFIHITLVVVNGDKFYFVHTLFYSLSSVWANLSFSKHFLSLWVSHSKAFLA